MLIVEKMMVKKIVQNSFCQGVGYIITIIIVFYGRLYG